MSKHQYDDLLMTDTPGFKAKNLISLREIRVQEVKKAFRSPCQKMPEKKRLRLQLGTGRFQKQEIRCIACGIKWLETYHDDIRAMQEGLKHG